MIDWAAIEKAGIEAAAGALTEGVALIAAKAKEKAPVRKVFEGQSSKERISVKTIAEVEGDRAIRQHLGLGPESTHIYPPTVVTQRGPQQLRWRALAGPGQLASGAAQARLSRQGRYELRSGRGVHNGQLGGRLRDEITFEAARISGRSVIARVVSPTPYAKFVEFGTRYMAARPYMRPAVYENTGTIKSGIARSVAGAARAAFHGTSKPVRITLKAVG